MTDADILERAADLLYVKGRTTGITLKEDGSMCPLGAVACASGFPVRLYRDGEVYAALKDSSVVASLAAWIGYLPAAFRPVDRVWKWNDDEDDDEVIIDGLRRCAKDLRAVEA